MARIGKIARLPKSHRESKLVQVKDFHRGDAEARRKSGIGDGATEGVAEPCGARRADSQLGDLAAWRDESEILDGGRGESNLVQAKGFSGALGNGVQATANPGEHRRRGGLPSHPGLLSNIGMRRRCAATTALPSAATISRIAAEKGREHVEFAFSSRPET